ncbi:unnamed protein product, partial [Porites lobata]
DPKQGFLKLNSPSGEESGRYTVTQTRRIITNSGGQTLQSSAENLKTVMNTTDGRHKDILDKQGVKTDLKYREEALEDAPTPGNNIKGSQQTLFLREDENKQKAKITVHTTEEAMATNKERTPVSVWCGYDNA